MKKKESPYDGNATKFLKLINLEEVAGVFCEVESDNNVLERIECNASTFKMFRGFGQALVEQPTLRECRKGLFGKIWTAEIWLNNKLKNGQLKLNFTKIEGEDPEKMAVEKLS
jgi:hypothetical protein